eukprot:1955742-Prorocentrum_lima.AAC.1
MDMATVWQFGDISLRHADTPTVCRLHLGHNASCTSWSLGKTVVPYVYSLCAVHWQFAVIPEYLPRLCVCLS